jgi:hypothetical protein
MTLDELLSSTPPHLHSPLHGYCTLEVLLDTAFLKGIGYRNETSRLLAVSYGKDWLEVYIKLCRNIRARHLTKQKSQYSSGGFNQAF